MLTGPNWQLAITSLQFRTGFCACWYPAWSYTLDKSHTTESTDVAENFQGSLLKNSEKLKKYFPSLYIFCLWCWSPRSLEIVFLLIMLFRWLWRLVNFWNLWWKNIFIYLFIFKRLVCWFSSQPPISEVHTTSDLWYSQHSKVPHLSLSVTKWQGKGL